MSIVSVPHIWYLQSVVGSAVNDESLAIGSANFTENVPQFTEYK